MSATNSADSLNFQSSGPATFSGGAINLWGGAGVTIPQFAYGATPQGAVTVLSAINLQAPQTWTNNSSSPLTINGNVNNGGNSLTIGGPGNAAMAGSLSGSGSLTKAGAGTLTMTGTNTLPGGVTVGGGALRVAATGSLAAGKHGTLYVGNAGPAAMTIQDSAAVNTNNLYVNYQNTGAGSSTLTITGGGLAVTGQSYIGRAPCTPTPARSAPPSTRAAAP